MLKRPMTFVQLGVAFGVLTALAATLVWQRAESARGQLELAEELTLPVEHRAHLGVPGPIDLVLLPQAAPAARHAVLRARSRGAA